MIRLGQTFDRRYTFITDGDPRDLSGITITFVLDDGRAVREFATGGTPLSGIVDIHLTAADLAGVLENNGAESHLKFDDGGGEYELKAHRIERIVAAGAPE